jgi:hypothetical protein
VAYKATRCMLCYHSYMVMIRTLFPALSWSIILDGGTDFSKHNFCCG